MQEKNPNEKKLPEQPEVGGDVGKKGGDIGDKGKIGEVDKGKLSDVVEEKKP